MNVLYEKPLHGTSLSSSAEICRENEAGWPGFFADSVPAKKCLVL